MSKMIVIVIIFLLQIGCGSAPNAKNGEPVANVPSPPAASVATPTPTEASTSPIVGVKVEKPETTQFVNGKIPDGWRWIDPDSQHNPTPHEAKDSKFLMRIPTGKDLYGENRTAPRLLKAVTGDFQIETRVRFDPVGDYQGAGLLIWVDGMNYLRLERSFGGLREGGSGIRLDARKHDQYDSLTTPGEIPTTATDVELKIIRRGHVFTAFWRDDENGEWREVEEFASDFPDSIQAGIIGCNTSGEIAAEFAYIRLLPQPVAKPF